MIKLTDNDNGDHSEVTLTLTLREKVTMTEIAPVTEPDIQ